MDWRLWNRIAPRPQGLRLRQFEQAVIDAFDAALPQRARELLRLQIGSYNKIYRLSRGKEVNFYTIRWFKPADLPAGYLFANSQGELHVARVRMQAEPSAVHVTADVWVVNGRFFSITFDHPVAQMRKEAFTVLECQLLEDPTKLATCDVQCPGTAVTKHMDMLRLPEVGEVSGRVAPADRTRRSKFEETWRAYLPQDYLALLSETDGFSLGRWRVLGTSARLVTASPQNLLVLAEGPEGWFICSPVTLSKRRNVALYYHDSHEPERTWDSFVDALAYVAKQEAAAGQD